MVKLVEPNYGRIVTLEVVAEEPLRHMCIGLLTCVADGKNIKANVSGNTVTLTFSDATTAEYCRSRYKK